MPHRGVVARYVVVYNMYIHIHICIYVYINAPPLPTSNPPGPGPLRPPLGLQRAPGLFKLLGPSSLNNSLAILRAWAQGL